MEKLLSTLFRGDPDATALCLDIFHWANAYDHLVDGDLTPHTDAQLVHVAMGHLISAMGSKFYLDNHEALRVSLDNAVSTWRLSTTLQGGGSYKALELAHVMRWAPIEFFLHCARILHGEDWVQEVGPWFWVEMTKDHTFDEFARECGE